jgi:hypothetical protein
MVIGFFALLRGFTESADRRGADGRRAAGRLQSVIVSFPMLPVAGQVTCTYMWEDTQ